LHRVVSAVTSGFVFAAVCLLASRGTLARAQADPAAQRRLPISVFAGTSAVETGLNGGRNASITAGIDVAFLPGRQFAPAIEYRGTLAIDKGGVDSQKNNLGGLQFAEPLGRLHPYLDLLFGRVELDYGSGFQVPGKPIFYTKSSSNVISPGAGIDVDISHNFAFKADIQLERYSTPVDPTHLYATAATLGLVYRLNFGRHPIAP
jgi:hypothetical protein